jgi:ribonuclease D
MQQLVYAAYDVLHLAKLYYCLCDKVAEIGRTEWHKELCADLELLEYIPDPEPHRNLPDANRLSAFHLHIAKALYAWRESLAKRWNMPPSNVVSNKQLVEWTTATQFNYTTWQGTKGLIGRVKNEKDFHQVRLLIQKATAEAETLKLAKVWERTRKGVHLRTREDAETLKAKLHELRSALREEHGETVGALMLSATQCETIVNGKDFTTLRQFAVPYIRKAAEKVGLDTAYFKL